PFTHFLLLAQNEIDIFRKECNVTYCHNMFYLLCIYVCKISVLDTVSTNSFSCFLCFHIPDLLIDTDAILYVKSSYSSTTGICGYSLRSLRTSPVTCCADSEGVPSICKGLPTTNVSTCSD